MTVRTLMAARLVDLLGSTTMTTPAYRGLADGIRLLIADGRITAGTRLPSERDLTAAVGLSRSTVTRAYAELRDAGFLTSRQGSGSVATLPGAEASRAVGLAPRGEAGPEVIDLTCAALAAPPGYLAACEAAVAALPRHLTGTGYHPLGLPELREAIAQDYTARGLATDVEQVMITSGALAAWSATARALLTSGDRVLMESPTYPNAIAAARRSGARPVALPLDPDGWDTGAVVAALRQTAPRAAYLIPDFHNPTGNLMGEAQRREIGEALRATHTVAVVDETVADLDLRPDAPARVAPLAVWHRSSVTLGGASKTYWGGVRVGWVRAPRELLGSIADARLTLDLSAPLLEQLVLLELLPQRDRILADRRQRLRAARSALVAALAAHLPTWRFTVPAGGMCLWIELPEALSSALTVAAERHGVMLAAGSQFAVEGGMERYLRIPFGDKEPQVIEEAVRRIALAWESAQNGVGGRAGRGTRLVA